jgi:hypothetical protein
MLVIAFITSLRIFFQKRLLKNLNVELISGQKLPDTLKVDKLILRQSMSKLRDTLKALIDPNSGFVDSLFYKKVLTNELATDIGNSLYNKNIKLLDFLLNRHGGDCSEVMEALVETGQLHVARFISSSGGTS